MNASIFQKLVGLAKPVQRYHIGKEIQVPVQYHGSTAVDIKGHHRSRFWNDRGLRKKDFDWLWMGGGESHD